MIISSRQEKIDRSLDFSSRRCREADRSGKEENYEGAMAALQKMTAKMGLLNATRHAQTSSTVSRNVSQLTTEERSCLLSAADSTNAATLANPNSVVSQLRRLELSRSPGVDGFTIERLNSVLLGGDRDARLKEGALLEYTTFLKKLVTGELTDHQSQLLHAIKI